MSIKQEHEYAYDEKSTWDKGRDVSVLVGQTITSVYVNEDGRDAHILFTTDEGYIYKMYHEQDCCEYVTIESIVGDVDDLIGQKIEVAESRSNSSYSEEDDSQTWTFYCIRCVKTSVDIRWHGSSNGYYSEGVTFERIK